jgi:hypothetical protein
MRKVLLFLLFVTGFCLHDGWSQTPGQLSSEPQSFSGGLDRLMGRNLNMQQRDELNRFIILWDSAAYSQPEMEIIINTTNLLISKNARPVPHLINYLALLNSFSEHDPNRRHFGIWQDAFLKILERKRLSMQQINDLMVQTGRLLSGNIIYGSSAVTWEITSSDYSFVFDDSLRIVVPETNLLGYNHIDTLLIFNTSGVLCPLTATWRGKGGRVTWERAGLDPREVYATPANYKIDLTRSEYNADFALLTNSRYLQLPVNGRLTDRVMTTRNSEMASYPAFISYRQEFRIDNIYNNIDYKGGLSMQGAKLIGSGGEEGRARLVFHREGEPFLRAESDHFVFRPQGVGSMNTSIVFYFDNDSLFHPDLQLNYVDNSRELSLNQNHTVISKSPWDNQYHKIDMNFARLVWEIDGPDMRLTMPRASSIGNASFRSFGFFDPHQYRELQGMDLNHPLISLRTMAGSIDSGEFPAADYARLRRMTLPAVRHQLLDLTLGGFIFFDTGNDMIRTRQKLYDYIDANAGRIDYDVIDFASTTRSPQENALLNLDTRELLINGIPQVHISNSQNVKIFPEDNMVTLLQNRNFLFGGIINAGLLNFFGSNFSFDYDKFAINLQSVDSLSMVVRLDERDDYGRARLAGVRNLIRSVTGDLYIDDPHNKSGRMKNPAFPKFASRENSYVFFDRPEIQRGAYKQDEFYYILYPFVIDSLNAFRDTELRFEGKLVSAGIFPEIEELLTLQEDFSLGIRYSLPADGLPAYGGRGRFYHNLQLSNQGFRGSGRLDFLTASVHSGDFLFLPSSMRTTADELVISKQLSGTEFPAVTSGKNNIQWLPQEQLMTVGRGEKGFAFFDNQSVLDGTLEISPTGLSGSGLFTVDMAELKSGKFSFMASSLRATDTELEFRDPRLPAPTLSAGRLEAFIDMDARKGSFTRTQRDDNLSLPHTGYAANPESFAWNMDDREFVLVSSASDPATGLNGARYISTVRGQDSLRFLSPRAVLDYDNHLLQAEGVKHIDVADSRIFPPEGKLTVGPQGRVLPLSNARLVTGLAAYSHEIYDADIEISSRKEYRGSGFYDYVDLSDSVQKIHFSRISVTREGETVAVGDLAEEDDFRLSPAFAFSGETRMNASRRHLNFRGSTRLIHDCDLKNEWLTFENEIDPSNVMIPVPERLMSAGRERIYSGIFVANDSIHLYPAFFTQRRNYADQLIIGAEGYMKFDSDKNEYIIASAEKLNNPSLPGNYLVLNPEHCIIMGEGRLELGITLGQLGMEATGIAMNRINSNETSIRGVMTLDFPFSAEAIALIARDADSLGVQPLDSSAWFFTGMPGNLTGAQRLRRLSATNGPDRQGRIPAELQKTLVFTHIDLVWNKESRSYVSRGQLGVGYVNGVEINRMFNGYLEITKRRSGDYLDLYLEMDGNRWYYFGYTRGVMQAYSSNRSFLKILDDLSLRQRTDRSSGAERYIYMLATDTKLEQFFRTYRQNTGRQVEDQVTEGVTSVRGRPGPVPGEETAADPDQSVEEISTGRGTLPSGQGGEAAADPDPAENL